MRLRTNWVKVVDKMLREVPYSGQSIDGEGFMIEDFPDLNCDVEHSVLTKMEQQDIHKVIDQLNYRGTHDCLRYFL